MKQMRSVPYFEMGAFMKEEEEEEEEKHAEGLWW